MAWFVLRRFGTLVLLVLGVTLVAFVLTHLVPSNPAFANLGEVGSTNAQAVKAFDERYGLEKPLPEQYWIYLDNLVHGNLGTSEVTTRPVLDDLEQDVPATIELAVASLLIAVPVGVGCGVLAAMKRNKPTDQVLRVISLAGLSFPIFWLGILAVFIFFYKLGWLPGSGRIGAAVNPPPHVTGFYIIDSLIAGDFTAFGSALQHLVLPALVLAGFNVAILMRFTRSAVLEVLHSDYIRNARAKGLNGTTILFHHILRAASPAILSVAGLVFANALVGTVLIENVFAWPGMGAYAYQAASNLDLPAITGVCIFVAIVYVVINLLVDLTYGFLDPRLSLTKGRLG